MNRKIIYEEKDELKIIRKISDIAGCLKRNEKKEISLFGGKVGIALFFMYYAKYSDKLTRSLFPSES